MSGIRDRLKEALSDFVEFDEEGQPSQDARPGHPAAAAHTTPVPGAAYAAGGPPGAPAGAPNTEMVGALEQAVAGSTLPGYDQFRTLLAAMSGVPDEHLRYAVALKAVEASFKTPPGAVLASVDDRLRILGAEQQSFERALARELETSVGGTTREIQDVSDAIARHQAEIRELEGRRTALGESLRQRQAELDRSRAEFTAAYASVQAGLAAERARIAAHLAADQAVDHRAPAREH